MTKNEPLLEVGRVQRPHGVKGEVSVAFTSNRLERRQVGASLKVGENWLTVETSRAHHGRILIGFKGFGDRNVAEQLSGQLIFAFAIVDPDVLWVHQLVGASVVDQQGVNRGEVVEVLDNPASDLLVLKDGALVPMVFITTFDLEKALIVIDAPDGLFEEDE